MSSSDPDLPAASTRSPVLRWIVVVLAAAAVPTLVVVLRSPRPPPASSFAVDVRVTPADARIALDRRPVAVGAWRTTLPRDGRAHLLELGAAGHRTERIYFTDAPPPRTVVLQALDAR